MHEKPQWKHKDESQRFIEIEWAEKIVFLFNNWQMLPRLDTPKIQNSLNVADLNNNSK